MQYGLIRSVSRFFYTTQQINHHALILYPKTEDIVLSGIFEPKCEAYSCPECKKIIIDYAKKFVE